MTTYTPTKSAAGRDWPAQLTADPTLWPQHGDWLSENEAEWRDRPTEADWYETTPGGSKRHVFADSVPYGQLPAHQQPPYLSYLTGKLVGLLDERRHGVEEVFHYTGKFIAVPTFATLFDREELFIRPRPGGPAGNQLVKVPGYLGDLARWMTDCGDPRAEAVGAVRVSQIDVHNGDGPQWWVFLQNGPARHLTVHATYPDAAREAIRRVHAMLSVACRACNANWRTTHFPEEGPCMTCCGLGWMATGGPASPR